MLHASCRLRVLTSSVSHEATRRELKIISPEQVDSYLVDAVPLSVDSMDLVLRRGWERFTDRYFDD